jgi:hypothetical protein
MASTNKHDFIGLLIRAGVIVVAGYGVYRVIRKFSSFKAGEQVSDVALLSTATTETDVKSDIAAT